MGAPTGIDVEALRTQNDDMRKEIENLKETIADLNTKLQEGGEDS